MTLRTIHIIDLDDGPHSGGGAALAELLSRHKIAHLCWTDSKASSGWHKSPHVKAVDDQGLGQALEQAGEDDLFFPGTRASFAWLDRVMDSGDFDWPSQLTSLMDWPTGGASLTQAKALDINTADSKKVSSIESRNAFSSLVSGGWLLGNNGELFAVVDDGDAWYQSNQLIRRGASSVSMIPSDGGRLFLACHYFDCGKPLQGTFLRVDSLRPSGRPALARTVDGSLWANATKDVAKFDQAQGFLQSFWLHRPKDESAQLVATNPCPPAWISLDQEGFLAALLGQQSDYQQTMAGRYYADAPLDFAIDPMTLLERSGS